MNSQRQRLLDEIKIKSESEIKKANEIKDKNKQEDFLKKIKNLKFKSSPLSIKTAIRRLIIKEFKLGKLFSASQLIKYKYILG